MSRWADHPGGWSSRRANGQHIHPIVLTWDVAKLVSTLPRHLGINALVAKLSERVIELELPYPELVQDLNTPDDLTRWREREAQRKDQREIAMSGSSACRLTIRLFAIARQKAGKPEIDVELPALPATVGDLRLALAMQHPALASLRHRVMIAVESDYAADETHDQPGREVARYPAGQRRLRDDDCVACDKERIMIEIIDAPIDHAALTERVRSHQAGAVCTFLGTVREMTAGRQTVSLAYEAYPEMANKKMAELEEEARSRWPIIELAIVHRVGHLDLGEISVVVAVSCPHRDQAFEACRWLIDTLKEVVPIWKQERWADGTLEWVHPGLGTS